MHLPIRSQEIGIIGSRLLLGVPLMQSAYLRPLRTSLVARYASNVAGTCDQAISTYHEARARSIYQIVEHSSTS